MRMAVPVRQLKDLYEICYWGGVIYWKLSCKFNSVSYMSTFIIHLRKGCHLRECHSLYVFWFKIRYADVQKGKSSCHAVPSTKQCTSTLYYGQIKICSSASPPSHGTTAPSGPGPPHFRGFTITLRHTTLGRTPLDQWSARRAELYLTTHSTQDQNTQLQQSSGRRPTP